MEELFINKNYVETRELKCETDPKHDKGLRVFRSSPGLINLQIRTFGGIGNFGKGVKRKMYSIVSLDKSETELLIAKLIEGKAEL